jgi:hypothetical protein
MIGGVVVLSPTGVARWDNRRGQTLQESAGTSETDGNNQDDRHSGKQGAGTLVAG